LTLENGELAWWKYAYEFARRGLHLIEITTHGPHPGADYLWGEATTQETDDISFTSTRGVQDYSRIRGLRIEDGEGTLYPVLRARELNQHQREWLKRCKKEKEEVPEKDRVK